MPQDNEERNLTDGEQSNPYIDEVRKASEDVKEPVSDEKEEGGEEEAGKEEQPLEESEDVKAFKESEAFTKLVASKAKSISDKSMQTYQKNQWKLESEKAKAEQKAKALERQVQTQANQQIEWAKWIEENPEIAPRVRNFQEAERYFYQLRDEVTAGKTELDKMAPRIQKTLNHEAAMELLSEVHGSDLTKITLAELNEVLQSYDEVDSEKMRTFVTNRLKKELGKKPKANEASTPVKVRRPDPGVTGTGSRGRNFTRQQINEMSPEEFAKNEDAIFKATKEGRIK